MTFTSVLVVNHQQKVEKALTISQIKELLMYEEELKRSARLSFEDAAKECQEGSEEFEANMRMALRYHHEASALHQLAVNLDDLIS